MPRRILDYEMATKIRYLRIHKQMPYNKIRLALNLTCPDSTIWFICNKPNYYIRPDQYNKLDIRIHSKIKNYINKFMPGTKARSEAVKMLADCYGVCTSTIYAYARREIA